MANRVRRRAWLSILGALQGGRVLVLAGAWPAGSQDIGPVPMVFADGAWANKALGGLNKPYVEPQGAWGEVIMANARWIVIQNAGRHTVSDFLRCASPVCCPLANFTLDIAAPDALS